jgi:hypothetical protein
MNDRSSWFYLPVDVRFARKATEVLRYREMTLWASKRHMQRSKLQTDSITLVERRRFA